MGDDQANQVAKRFVVHSESAGRNHEGPEKF